MLLVMRWICVFLLLPGLVSTAGQAQKPVPAAGAAELVQAGKTALQRGDQQGAIDDFSRALEMRPDLIEARSSLASAYFRIGDLNHARFEFERLHEELPQDTGIAMQLGYTLVKLGRDPDAVQVLLPLEGGKEGNAELEYVLAFAMIQSRREAEGLPRMEKYASTAHAANAWMIAGSTRLTLRSFREAATDLEAAVAQDPSLPGAYSQLGQARFALGQTEEAEKAFQLALRADARDVTANLYMGIIRLKQRDFENARALLELTLQLVPTLPLAHLKMAELNSMTGHFEEAAKELEDLEKKTPEWPDPHVGLAALYYKMHRPEDGKREREIVEKLEAEAQKGVPSSK
jgi:Flp pilus assembly protein TadD